MIDSNSTALVPTAGRREGSLHHYPLRVYFEDVDAAGIVYHANYLRFCERARTEMMRELGIPHVDMMAETGVAFAVRNCEIDFRRPARLEEALEIVTALLDIGPATLTLQQTVRKLPGSGAIPPQSGGIAAEDLVTVRLRLCCIDQRGRPVRVPVRVRQALDRLSGSAAGGL
jgi:acyl-CoA thioester hydrolase